MLPAQEWSFRYHNSSKEFDIDLKFIFRIVVGERKEQCSFFGNIHMTRKILLKVKHWIKQHLSQITCFMIIAHDSSYSLHSMFIHSLKINKSSLTDCNAKTNVLWRSAHQTQALLNFGDLQTITNPQLIIHQYFRSQSS